MRERGQSIVELVVVLPLLLITLSGLLDLSRVYYTLVVLEDMASKGATYAATHPDVRHVEDIQTRATYSSTERTSVDPADVRVEYPAHVAPGASITVTVPYSFTFINPLARAMVEGGAIELSETAVRSITPNR